MKKGLDPRDYAMVAFGGSGPLQAARVAELLGLPTTLIPPNPGNLDARESRQGTGRGAAGNRDAQGLRGRDPVGIRNSRRKVVSVGRSQRRSAQHAAAR